MVVEYLFCRACGGVARGLRGRDVGLYILRRPPEQLATESPHDLANRVRVLFFQFTDKGRRANGHIFAQALEQRLVRLDFTGVPDSANERSSPHPSRNPSGPPMIPTRDPMRPPAIEPP